MQDIPADEAEQLQRRAPFALSEPSAVVHAVRPLRPAAWLDEANIETHGHGANESSDDDRAGYPRWSERVTRMVRDRNHPSVIIWSLGNQSATALITTHSIAGSNLSILPARYSMKAEGADTTATDIICPMYARAWMKTPALPAVPKWSIKIGFRCLEKCAR